MVLVRRLVVAAMKFDILFHAVHVPEIYNPLADALSRQGMEKARRLAPSLAPAATPTPSFLLPEAILQPKSWEQLWLHRHD